MQNGIIYNQIYYHAFKWILLSTLLIEVFCFDPYHEQTNNGPVSSYSSSTTKFKQDIASKTVESIFHFKRFVTENTSDLYKVTNKPQTRWQTSSERRKKFDLINLLYRKRKIFADVSEQTSIVTFPTQAAKKQIQGNEEKSEIIKRGATMTQKIPSLLFIKSSLSTKRFNSSSTLPKHPNLTTKIFFFEKGSGHLDVNETKIKSNLKEFTKPEISLDAWFFSHPVNFSRKKSMQTQSSPSTESLRPLNPTDLDSTFLRFKAVGRSPPHVFVYDATIKPLIKDILQDMFPKTKGDHRSYYLAKAIPKLIDWRYKFESAPSFKNVNAKLLSQITAAKAMSSTNLKVSSTLTSLSTIDTENLNKIKVKHTFTIQPTPPSMSTEIQDKVSFFEVYDKLTRKDTHYMDNSWPFNERDASKLFLNGVDISELYSQIELNPINIETNLSPLNADDSFDLINESYHKSNQKISFSYNDDPEKINLTTNKENGERFAEFTEIIETATKQNVSRIALEDIYDQDSLETNYDNDLSKQVRKGKRAQEEKKQSLNKLKTEFLSKLQEKVTSSINFYTSQKRNLTRSPYVSIQPVHWRDFPYTAAYVYEPSQVHCDAAALSPHWLLASGACLSRHSRDPAPESRSAYVAYCGENWRQPRRIAYVKYTLVHPMFNLRDKTRRYLYNIGLIQVVNSMMTSCAGWSPVSLMSHQYAAETSDSLAMAVGWGLDRYGTKYATTQLPNSNLTSYEAYLFSNSCPGAEDPPIESKVKRDESGFSNVYCLSLPAYEGEDNDPVHGGILLVGGKLIALYLQEGRLPQGEQSAVYTGVWRLIPWLLNVAQEPEYADGPSVELLR